MLCVALARVGALPAAVALAAGASTKVRVSPGRGGIHTNFKLRFAIPRRDRTLDRRCSDSDSIVVTRPVSHGLRRQADVPAARGSGAPRVHDHAEPGASGRPLVHRHVHGHV